MRAWESRAYRREWDSLFQTHNVFLSSQSPDLWGYSGLVPSEFELYLSEWEMLSLSIRLYWKRCWAHRGEARIHPAVCAALLMIHTCSCAHPPHSLPGDRQIAACRSRVRCTLIGRAVLSVRWGLRGRGYYIAPYLHTSTFSLSLPC